MACGPLTSATGRAMAITLPGLGVRFPLGLPMLKKCMHLRYCKMAHIYIYIYIYIYMYICICASYVHTMSTCVKKTNYLL